MYPREPGWKELGQELEEKAQMEEHRVFYWDGKPVCANEDDPTKETLPAGFYYWTGDEQDLLTVGPFKFVKTAIKHAQLSKEK